MNSFSGTPAANIRDADVALTLWLVYTPVIPAKSDILAIIPFGGLIPTGVTLYHGFDGSFGVNSLAVCRKQKRYWIACSNRSSNMNWASW